MTELHSLTLLKKKNTELHNGIMQHNSVFFPFLIHKFISCSVRSDFFRLNKDKKILLVDLHPLLLLFSGKKRKNKIKFLKLFFNVSTDSKYYLFC